MNIPNILTTIRLIMIPLYVYTFGLEGEIKLWSAVIFVLASFTDVLDGYIARKYNQSTKWGQLMDPLADKLMQITVITTMVFAKIIPLWFVVILVAKELLMLIGSAFLLWKKIIVKANIFGKLNTVFLFLVITLLLLIPSTNNIFETILLCASIGFSVFTMATYL
ncbi:MAG: CDP-alcohol phosphatidyltransferase family protein, partial [Oscillospiraceae bacterium]